MLDRIGYDELIEPDVNTRAVGGQPLGRSSSSPTLAVHGTDGDKSSLDLGTVDLEAAERAARAFLTALGVDTRGESRRRTPQRMARAYAELFAPRPFAMTTFPNDEGYDELVIARSLPMRSVCEHHLLPFVGVAHVGYLPDDRIVGLSKLARVVQHFASRPQVQERLTKQVADWLQSQLQPKAVGVVIVAEHTCMSLRGAEARGSSTVTSSLQGLLRTDPRCRQEFMSLTGMAA